MLFHLFLHRMSSTRMPPEFTAAGAKLKISTYSEAGQTTGPPSIQRTSGSDAPPPKASLKIDAIAPSGNAPSAAADRALLKPKLSSRTSAASLAPPLGRSA